MKRRQSMNRISVAIGLCLCLFLSAFQVQAASSLVYIGTWGTWDHGVQDGPDIGLPKDNPPQGIYAARLDNETGKLTLVGVQAILEAADWFVLNPNLPVLYTVASSIGGRNEETDVLAYSIDKNFGKLYLLSQQKSGGRDATHLALDLASNTMFVANYGDGAVSALPVLSDGSLGPVVSMMRDYGETRAGSHGVAMDPTHRYVLSACAPSDRIFVYRFDAATRTLMRADPPFEATPPGTAPRHLAFHPNGQFVYLSSGGNAEVQAYSFDASDGNLALLQRIPTYSADWEGMESLSEISISKGGRFVYVGIREGQDSLAVYEVNQQNGTLTEIQRVSSQGDAPWSFSIDPTGKWMLVTNRDSNSVHVFSVDSETGKLEATGESLSIPRPVTVVFLAN